MAVPRPLEAQLLQDVHGLVDRIVAGTATTAAHAARLDVLEAVAAELSGVPLDELRDALGGPVRTLPVAPLRAACAEVTARLCGLPMPPALALAALGREPLGPLERRRSGQYYTDFRLAAHLAAGVASDAGDAPVLDPAAGSGILLAALATAVPADRRERLIAERLCAADLSATALRACGIALASLARDPATTAALRTRLRAQDSLLVGPDGWRDVAPDGFGVVIGNPPWEKLKLTRHEHLRAAGVERRYGDDLRGGSARALRADRRRLADYAAQVGASYEHGGGEVDLYKVFVALAFDLAADGGRIAYLVPAGLLRSESTGALREALLARASALRIAVSDNRPRYFGIDMRFKFLAVTATLGPGARPPLRLDHLRGTDVAVRRTSSVAVDRGRLRRVRPDLTVPEVRTAAEWRLFGRLAERGVRADDPRSPWFVPIVREIDMSRDRSRLRRAAAARPGDLPVLEGRMVHQFRHDAKRYASGAGRAAAWEVAEPGGPLGPQFVVAREDLSAVAAARVGIERLGFCDVSAQTNERSMLAARIPAGVVCGNKVPTLTFSSDPGDVGDRGRLWLALVDSLAFDWLLRRVMTTSVNYFLLRSVPLPRVDPATGIGAELAARAGALDALLSAPGADGRTVADLRAGLDARAFSAYGCTDADVEVVLGDFPQLDAAQPPLPGEPASTVTADLVRAARGDATAAERVVAARAAGAEGYVRNEAARAGRRAARQRPAA